MVNISTLREKIMKQNNKLDPGANQKLSVLATFGTFGSAHMTDQSDSSVKRTLLPFQILETKNQLLNRLSSWGLMK
jgi:hypothetical protein